MVKLEGLVGVCLSGNQTSRSCSHSGANSQLDVQPDLTMQSVSHLRDVGGGRVAGFICITVVYYKASTQFQDPMC